MKRDLSEIMPAWSMENVRKMFDDGKERLSRDFLGGIELVVNDLRDDGNVFVYLGNHTTMLDYVSANYSILQHGLPYPVSVVGSNLNNPEYAKAIVDFKDWGVIWHDRADKSREHLAKYISAMGKCAEEKQPVLVYPEGARNRNPEAGLIGLKENLFRILVTLDRNLSSGNHKISVVPFAADYGDYPEKGRWAEIGNLGSANYHDAERKAFIDWKKRAHQIPHPNVYIGFGEPFPVSKYSEGKGTQLLEETRKRITDLRERVSSHRISAAA